MKSGTPRAAGTEGSRHGDETETRGSAGEVFLQFLKRAFCVGRLCSDHADLARREWSPCRPPVLVQWRDEDLVFRHRSEADQFHRLSLGQNGVDGNAPEQLRKLEAFATHRAIASSIVVTVDEDLAPEFRCARLLSLFDSLAFSA